MTSTTKPHRIAVLLAGCGVYDGSETTETVSFLVHLDRCGADVTMFAPDIEQHHAVDHTKGSEMETPRRVLVESARIARGKISPLSALEVDAFDAIVIPGGFGVAKNLSTFAFDGDKMTVLPLVETVLKAFHAEKKPIGFCCISPVLAGRVFPGCEVTVGKSSGDEWPHSGTAAALTAMGATVVEKEGNEIHVDVANRFVSCPAYMHDSTPYAVFMNIGQLVDGLVEML